MIKEADSYKIPEQTHIGHVHLKVSDLQRSLDFYCEVLGFEVTTSHGDAAFISAGGYHHHIGLNTWYSKNMAPAPKNSAGLFHIALVYPTRKSLAAILQRLIEKKYPVSGAADHGVSEAIYLEDPDKNGVELYWDRPETEWPKHEDGTVNMATIGLDVTDLLNELER